MNEFLELFYKKYLVISNNFLIDGLKSNNLITYQQEMDFIHNYIKSYGDNYKIEIGAIYELIKDDYTIEQYNNLKLKSIDNRTHQFNCKYVKGFIGEVGIFKKNKQLNLIYNLGKEYLNFIEKLDLFEHKFFPKNSYHKFKPNKMYDV